jgi:hypothetical protein
LCSLPASKVFSGAIFGLPGGFAQWKTSSPCAAIVQVESKALSPLLSLRPAAPLCSSGIFAALRFALAFALEFDFGFLNLSSQATDIRITAKSTPE